MLIGKDQFGEYHNSDLYVPAQVGVYLMRKGNNPNARCLFRYWDGEYWYCNSISPRGAMDKYLDKIKGFSFNIEGSEFCGLKEQYDSSR